MQDQIGGLTGIINILKTLWIGVAIFVLYVSLDSYDGKPYSDIWIFLTWGMLYLSFPAGLLVSLAHLALGFFFSITVKTSNFSLLLEWVTYFVLGYIQWFKLVPYLITKAQRILKTGTK